jgi:hypothetical protein
MTDQGILRTALRELRAVALLAARKPKEVPTTLFEKTFYDIREAAKRYKEEQSQKARLSFIQTVTDDLTKNGLHVVSFDVSLGKYKGSRFVTSAKLFVRFGTETVKPNQSGIKNLEAYLQAAYSPKFHYKSFTDGTAFFNVR